MKQMKNKQYGIGFAGWTSILGVLACIVLFGLRLFPLYNEKFSVIASMNSVANKPNAEKLSTKDIRKYFLRNMEITNTTRFTDDTVKDLAKVIKDKKTKKKYLHVAYEGRNELVKDIKLLIVFDHKVELGGSTSE